jgi:K+-transporting ATPase ATPase A chain
VDAFIGPITQHAWLTMAVYFGVLLLCVKPLGMYIANVMQGKLGFAARIENVIYRICGVRASEEMHWSRYAISLLVFSLFGALAVYALQRLQVWLPLNPQQMANVTPDSSFNTAVSFVTNTNWQGYAGEATMSYLTQMLGLAVQNFLSAASGIVVVIALIRGLARHSMNTIGNVWVDLTRVTLFILLPISFVLALALVSQGAIQSFDAYQEASTLDVTSYETAKLDADGQPVMDEQGNAVTETVTTQTQTLPMAPLASQLAIKMLGTNGGGIFNANSAHPYENPTPLSNFLQMLAIFLIPAALCYTFGRMVATPARAGPCWRRCCCCSCPLQLAPCTSNNRATRLLRRWASTKAQAHGRPVATWRARRRALVSPTQDCLRLLPRRRRAAR